MYTIYTNTVNIHKYSLSIYILRQSIYYIYTNKSIFILIQSVYIQYVH